MKFELTQTFHFDAAHTLKRHVPVDEYAASARIHGHSYTAEVTVVGTPDAEGMVTCEQKYGKRKRVTGLDLYALRSVIGKCREKLDHRFLDEVEGLGPATLENLCKFIATEITKDLPVYSVTVSRQSGDRCRMVLS